MACSDKIRYSLCEYKRAGSFLPHILLEAVVLMILTGIIAFSCAYSLSRNKESRFLQVGLVVYEEESVWMDFAVEFVENMEGVQELCHMMTLEEEHGISMVTAGELDVLVILPPNMMEGILDGKNIPAKVMINPLNPELTQIFQILADSGIGMLQTAQAEIYSTYELLAGEETLEQIQEYYQKLNQENMGMLLGRERIFRERMVGATGKLEWMEYFLSAGITFYLLTMGLLLRNYLDRKSEKERMLASSLTVSSLQQIFVKQLGAFGLLLAGMVPIGLVLSVARVRNLVLLYPTVEKLLVFFLAVWTTAAISILCYRLAGKNGGMLLLLILSTGMQYAAGGFLPRAFLPEMIRKVWQLNPGTWILNGIQGLFMQENMDKNMVWNMLLLSVGILLIVLFCEKLKKWRGKFR